MRDQGTKSNYSRNTEDLFINTFGKTFTDMCQCLDLYIINGTRNTNSSLYTYIHPQGNSDVGYFLLSSDLLCDIVDFTVHEMIESLHMPISLSVAFNFVVDNYVDVNYIPINRFIMLWIYFLFLFIYSIILYHL